MDASCIGVVIYSRVIVSSIQGIDYMVVLRGANEVLITIMRSMLYVSPHNNIIRGNGYFSQIIGDTSFPLWPRFYVMSILF